MGMNAIQAAAADLKAAPKTWLITGVAGFIGSNLLEYLLKLDQYVVGLDNFSTGYQRNLDEVASVVSAQQWGRFRFYEGDICDLETCISACKGADFVLHQAALGSVPRSLADPLLSNQVNIDGFLNMLVASREAGIKHFVYAASSSTYGDHSALPKVEEVIGRPLSPYAVTKYVNELYADVFYKSYGISSSGLRYFNVFGPRQDPNGAYAAVIPKWVASIIGDEKVRINGDGETSRDFCYIENVVQANVLAAYQYKDGADVYNVAVGDQTSLNSLFELLKEALEELGINYDKRPEYQEFRAGDVRHSRASIGKAHKMLGYSPEYKVRDGINKSIPWYVDSLSC